MFKKVSPVVLMLVVAVAVVGAVMMMRMRKNEGFDTTENDIMENVTNDFLVDAADESNTIKKEDIEKAAAAAALQFCPVPPDYNPSLYIKKTELEKEQACPKVPNMKDYVLKSSIPPPRECPPCICPKVNVSAGLCKDSGKEEELVCPPPKPCGAEECAKVVKCPAPSPSPSNSLEELDETMVNNYINNLIREKEYKQINKFKNLLNGVETPSDLVSDLQEENEELRQKIKQLEMRITDSDSNYGSNSNARLAGMMSNKRSNARLAGMMSNKRSNTNSPVVEYNQKCQNNRVDNWYDISGIIGSAFNSNTDPANNAKLNSVNNNVDTMMNKSNNMAANNLVLKNFY